MAGDVMSKEQQNLIYSIRDYTLDSTNMTEDEAYRFAFRCYQLDMIRSKRYFVIKNKETDECLYFSNKLLIFSNAEYAKAFALQNYDESVFYINEEQITMFEVINGDRLYLKRIDIKNPDGSYTCIDVLDNIENMGEYNEDEDQNCNCQCENINSTIKSFCSGISITVSIIAFFIAAIMISSLFCNFKWVYIPFILAEIVSGTYLLYMSYKLR